MRIAIKCGTAILSYVGALILGMNYNWGGKIFTVLNSEYVNCYGGMNAGDGLGFLAIFLPLSIAMLSIGIGVSGALAAVKSITELHRNATSGSRDI